MDEPPDASPDSTESTTSIPAETTTTPQVEESAADLSTLPGELLVRRASGALELLLPDGTTAQTIAEAGPIRSQPTWSGDGDQIAWTSIGANGPTIDWSNLRNSTSGSVATPAPAFFHHWSPDGTRLASLGPAPQGVALTLTSLEPSTIETVGVAQPFFIEWSAVDDELVGAINGESLVRIGDADDVRPVDLGAPLGMFQAPRVLPDGEVIVVVATLDGGEIRRSGPTGSTTLATINGGAALSLDHDGRRLAVLTAPDPDGGRFETVSLSNAQDDPPVPSLPPRTVSIVDLETGEVTTRPESAILAINWSPDGEWLAMLQASDARVEWIWATDDAVDRSGPFVPSAELARSYLPFADQYDLNSTLWSPDSSAFLVVGSFDGSGTAAVHVDVLGDGEAATRVADGDVAFWSPVGSP